MFPPFLLWDETVKATEETGGVLRVGDAMREAVRTGYKNALAEVSSD